MTTRGLYVFKHDSELGNAPAHALFERIQVQRKEGVEAPRSFADYMVSVAADDLPNGISLIRPC
jgi:CRISPR-associated protein Csd2